MKLRKKIEEVKQIIKDLGDIINICDSVTRSCTSLTDYEAAKRELVITYEERERQYKRLKQLEERAV